MPEETKQFKPGDRVKVIKEREALYHRLGETATVLSSKFDSPDPVIRVRWDRNDIPREQNCWADQFEIVNVTQIKVMDDTREYLEAITGGSSNG